MLGSLELWPRCRQPASRWEGTTLFWMRMCCSPCRSSQTPTTMACMPNSSTTTAPTSWHLAPWAVSLSTSLSSIRRKCEEKVRESKYILCSQLSALNLVALLATWLGISLSITKCGSCSDFRSAWVRVWSLRKEPEHHFLNFLLIFSYFLSSLFTMNAWRLQSHPELSKSALSHFSLFIARATVFCIWKYCTALSNTSATSLCLVSHLETNRPLLAPVLNKLECMRLEGPPSKSQLDKTPTADTESLRIAIASKSKM